MQVPEEKIKGFSILELIVVVVIIGIVSAIGYPNFTEWRKDREVRAAAVDIRSLIEGINAQVQRGQYVFVQVHVRAGSAEGGRRGAADALARFLCFRGGVVVVQDPEPGARGERVAAAGHLGGRGARECREVRVDRIVL